MYRSHHIFRMIHSVAVIASLLIPSAHAFGQTRSRAAKAVASNKSTSAPKCSGAWTGTVTYTRDQTLTNNKREPRVSGRGEDTTDFEMKYEYKGQISVIEDPSRTGSSMGRGTVTHKLTSSETVEARESNSCDRGKTWKEMSGTSKSETETSGTEEVSANVNIGINADGTYSVSVAMPQIKGLTKGTQSSTYSGQCTPKEGKTFNMPPTPTTIDGNSLTSDGSHRIDGSDPNSLSGTYTFTGQGVTEKITWSLQKCGAPLRLIDLKFEDMKFPNWNEWREITEQTGTIDGNWVKIKAKVLNASPETKFAEINFKETFKGDKWDGARPDAPLQDSVVSIRLLPGEEREVETIWDSSGYAWYDDGRPRLVQRIKAELTEDSKKVNEIVRNLKVAPKPVVLVHGFWSNWRRFEAWQNILTTSHSYDWKAYPVGEKPEKGVMNTGGTFLSTDKGHGLGENARPLESYIKYAQEDRNAWHVDVVAHSSGGLTARYYIQQIMPVNSPDGRPQISHLLMLGTPNEGSSCADSMYLAFNFDVLRQLRREYIADFNTVNYNRKGVKYSALGGNPLPVMCREIENNDGFVSVPSAISGISDNAQSGRIHTDLTGTEDFSGFVKPRLAVGPKGNHMPEVPTMSPGRTGQNASKGAFTFASYSPDSPMIISRGYGMQSVSSPVLPTNSAGKDFATAVKLAGKQTVEIEIPVEALARFGVTFMAIPDISATLLNDKNVIAGKNLARTPEANAWFRSIHIDKGAASGTWKLRLENTSDRETEAFITAWFE